MNYRQILERHARQMRDKGITRKHFVTVAFQAFSVIEKRDRWTPMEAVIHSRIVIEVAKKVWDDDSTIPTDDIRTNYGAY